MKKSRTKAPTPAQLIAEDEKRVDDLKQREKLRSLKGQVEKTINRTLDEADIFKLGLGQAFKRCLNAKKLVFNRKGESHEIPDYDMQLKTIVKIMELDMWKIDSSEDSKKSESDLPSFEAPPQTIDLLVRRRKEIENLKDMDIGDEAAA